eukprot:366308-Chlamydomonas_euryale.AAC.4
MALEPVEHREQRVHYEHLARGAVWRVGRFEARGAFRPTLPAMQELRQAKKRHGSPARVRRYMLEHLPSPRCPFLRRSPPQVSQPATGLSRVMFVCSHLHCHTCAVSDPIAS